jgi:hypothetical protein
VSNPALAPSMLIRSPVPRRWRYRMKRLASLVFGAAFASTGAWFLYRHLVYAGFFDPWFALLACLMVAAGLGLLWLARR